MVFEMIIHIERAKDESQGWEPGLLHWDSWLLTISKVLLLLTT